MKWSPGEAQRRASGERGQHRGSAASSPYLHGGPNRVESQGLIHQDAMPQSYGRLRRNFFTTSREVAEDAADMRDGLGHGWIHAAEPTGDFEWTVVSLSRGNQRLHCASSASSQDG